MSNNKNHFVFQYEGNKRNEVNIIYNMIENFDVKNIIEPFCGTCAFSYFLSLRYPKKYNYILNDNNEELIELLNILKDKEKIIELEIDINIICSDPEFNKQMYKNLKGLHKFIIHRRVCYIVTGLFPLNYKYKYIDILNCPIINFFMTENVTITNDDGLICYKKYENDENSILFIDPPYLIADNTAYKHPTLNMYEYIFNQNLKDFKSCILISSEYNFLIKLLFEKYTHIVYDKNNQHGKRQNKKHIIVSNKNFTTKANLPSSLGSS